MSRPYLKFYRMPVYAALPQNEYRLSPGDGLKGLKFRPSWL